jgi:hypothetical protein
MLDYYRMSIYNCQIRTKGLSPCREAWHESMISKKSKYNVHGYYYAKLFLIVKNLSFESLPGKVQFLFWH